MKLSEQFPDLGTMLVRKLLKFPGDNIGKRRPVVNVSTVELIYQLGKKQDSSYEDRCEKLRDYEGFYFGINPK